MFARRASASDAWDVRLGDELWIQNKAEGPPTGPQSPPDARTRRRTRRRVCTLCRPGRPRRRPRRGLLLLLLLLVVVMVVVVQRCSGAAGGAADGALLGVLAAPCRCHAVSGAVKQQFNAPRGAQIWRRRGVEASSLAAPAGRRGRPSQHGAAGCSPCAGRGLVELSRSQAAKEQWCGVPDVRFSPCTPVASQPM